MRWNTTSKLLLGGGVVVGVIGSLGILAGFEPVPVAGWLVNVGMYKLVFAASGGLMLAGAVVGRWANRAMLPPSAPRDVLPSNEGAANALLKPAEPAPPAAVPRRSPVRDDHS